MKIVIAGAGSVGRSVALELLAHGHEITLIDKMPEKLRISSVADADWVLADACSPDALRDAAVEEADVMVAATGDDKANLVISLLSKTEFAVPRVVARLNNPKNEWLFDQAWGVDVSVSTPRIMTALVEEAVSVGIPVRLFSFNTAAVSMHALILPDDSPVVGKRVHSLELPPRSARTMCSRLRMNSFCSCRTGMQSHWISCARLSPRPRKNPYQKVESRGANPARLTMRLAQRAASPVRA